MQVWNNNENGFRQMLRLSSMLGIVWWWCCLLVLASAALDAKSQNSSSAGESRMFGGFLFRRRTNQVPDTNEKNSNDIDVEQDEYPLDWSLDYDEAEDKTFHSDDVRLPLDPEAYMTSVRSFFFFTCQIIYFAMFSMPTIVDQVTQHYDSLVYIYLLRISE